MKIIVICGAGIGSSAILKVNVERVLARLDIEADVTAAHLSSLAVDAADAQVILTSAEFVDAIGDTNADVIVIGNYFDTDELSRKLQETLG